jgi:Fe-S cluster assembly iron-binding protein IscA
MTREITITDGAAQKIRALLVGAKYGSGMRVKVVEGGCSEFQYKMDLDFPAALEKQHLEEKQMELSGVANEKN